MIDKQKAHRLIFSFSIILIFITVILMGCDGESFQRSTSQTSSSDVPVSESPVIPVPSALILAGIGIGFVVWLRKRKML